MNKAKYQFGTALKAIYKIAKSIKVVFTN